MFIAIELKVHSGVDQAYEEGFSRVRKILRKFAEHDSHFFGIYVMEHEPSENEVTAKAIRIASRHRTCSSLRMSESEFEAVANRIMGVLNTQGVDSADRELKAVNEKLRDENQHLEYSGTLHLANFILCDARTNEKICECRLGNITHWPKTS